MLIVIVMIINTIEREESEPDDREDAGDDDATNTSSAEDETSRGNVFKLLSVRLIKVINLLVSLHNTSITFSYLHLLM